MNPVIDRLMSELMECNDKRMEAEVEIHNLKSKIAAAERERDELKTALKECLEALENYGNHRAHCQLGYSDQKCNCGFYEALAKAKEVLK